MEMLTIVEIARGRDNRHALQAQSGRGECWLEGWIVLPEGLRDEFDACGGYCELEIRDGVLTALRPDGTDPTPWYRGAEEKREQIGQLKQELAGTDYRVLKCCEASLLGGEAPYDLAELVARRQELRQAVNAAQAGLAELERRIEDYLEGAEPTSGL